MPLTIIPFPILHDGKFCVNADGEAENSKDEEGYANAQNGWDSSGGVCEIWLDTWGRTRGWHCLQYCQGNAFDELWINLAGRHNCVKTSYYDTTKAISVTRGHLST